MDLTTRLAALDEGSSEPPSEALLAADLTRGRRARGRRRLRMTAAGSALALVAVGTATFAAVNRPATNPHRSVATSSIRLVDYSGAQKHGFDVTQIPEGWELKDSTPGYLDIAPPSDHTDGSMFEGKLVVMLRSVDDTGPLRGAPVTVNGRAGAIADQDGVKILVYSDGTHMVDIQAWSNLGWSNDQLVSFAEGVTVTSDAVAGRG